MTQKNHQSRSTGVKKTSEQPSDQGALDLDVADKPKETFREVAEKAAVKVDLEIAANARKKRRIEQYVTNPEGNVYCITNLPEEFIAVLFAWVSRSPKSFKEHLQEALDSGLIETPTFSDGAYSRLTDKASAFHEKWTVSYGHSSVAEHAIAHVGVEKVSRLASAALELSNEFYAITEYSQRYQKPVRGGWYNPFEEGNPFYDSFEEYMNHCFDVFEKLIDGVYNHLKSQDADKIFPASILEQQKRDAALMKLAFEDARYALPLSVYTQLGMTANGRAWRDGIAELMNSDYPEVQDMAEGIKAEVTKVLPTLLRHANASQYKVNSKKRVRNFEKNLIPANRRQSDVNLLAWEPEELAIHGIIGKMILEESGIPHIEAVQRARLMGSAREKELIGQLLFEMGSNDMAPDVFKSTHYEAEFLVSEANWHQLLRHNRRVNFTFNEPTVDLGMTIPPRIKEAGLSSLLTELSEASDELFNDYANSSLPETAAYVVLNAHKRRIVANFSLWEVYHLFNLRTSPEAQWDIRNAFEDLLSQVEKVHPTLIKSAKRR